MYNQSLVSELLEREAFQRWPLKLQESLRHLDNLLQQKDLVVWHVQHCTMVRTPLRGSEISISVNPPTMLRTILRNCPEAETYIISSYDFCILELHEVELEKVISCPDHILMLLHRSGPNVDILIFNQLVNKLINRNR